ncbi:MAG: MetQ/NlpA family ABC transporter substrate-binding protein [Oscillospiraceae bacterium]
MKKIISVLTALALLITGLTGCAAASGGEKKLTIGASVSPHAEILGVARDILQKEGITLEIKEFDDYVLPNTAVENGELDANYFQHQPYLTDFNAQNGTHLVSVGAIHYEPFGLYPGKSKTVAEVPEGGSVSVPNDGTNEARALMLLEAQGLIKMKEGADFTATILDIAENPKNLKIQELNAAQIARSLPDVDLGVINGNYAMQAGLNAAKDAIAIEADAKALDTYANVLVVKEGNEKNELIAALLKALKSDEVKKFVEEKYQGAVILK